MTITFMLNPIDYKNHKIFVYPSTPKTRAFVRILKNGIYKQTCNTVKDAKRVIDFNLKHKVWK